MKHIRLTRKRFLVVLFVLLLGITWAPTAHAVEVMQEETVTIAAGEVIADDLMVFANELVMDGTINGDLIAFVNKATINGTIDGDFMGAGQEIIINVHKI